MTTVTEPQAQEQETLVDVPRAPLRPSPPRR